MSRFLDRLEKIGRGVPISMGFTSGVHEEKAPTMALLGSLSNPARFSEGGSIIAKVGMDGALFLGTEEKKNLKELTKTLGKIPWGIKVQGLSADQANGFRGQGCDFLAFAPEAAFLEAVEDDDTGYLLCVESDMEEWYLRAIEDLPVDAVLLRPKSLELPLTFQHLITIGSVRSSFSKYLLLEVPGTLSAGEIEGLREIGVDGLVVDATVHSAEEIGALKESLLARPRRQRSARGKASAILPASSYAAHGGPGHDEEEDDDDF